MQATSRSGISRTAAVVAVIVVIVIGGVGAYFTSTIMAPTTTSTTTATTTAISTATTTAVSTATITTATTVTTTAPKRIITIGVLLVGEENDLSWNEAIYQAAIQTAQQMNASGSTVVVHFVTGLATSTEILPAIQADAGQNYTIIIGGGEEDQAPALQVEGNYPKIGFLVAGGYATTPNQGLVSFRGDQSGFLMGVTAALISQTGKVAIIGGLDVSAIAWTTQGFLLGVTYANHNFGKNVSVINTFVGNFDDPAASQSAAATAVAQGADVLFCSGDGITEGVAAEAVAANVKFLYYENNATAMAPNNTWGGSAFTWTPAFENAINDWLDTGHFATTPYYASLFNHGLTIGLSPKVPSNDSAVINRLYTNLVNGNVQVYQELSNGTLVWSPVTPAYDSLSG